MAFTEIVTRVVVAEEVNLSIVEEFQNLLDSLIERRVAIFDSEISTTLLCEVEGADEIRREMLEPDVKT